MIRLGFFLFLVLTFNFTRAQTMFSAEYPRQSDFKVYVVDHASQADLLVHKVKYKHHAKNNQGLWFFVDYKNQAKKSVYFVEYQSQADLLIHFVDYKSQAGWKTKSKKHVLY